MRVLEELRRRSVFRAGTAYLVTAWLILQVLDVVLPLLEAPASIARYALFLLIGAFPFVVVMAWVFEWTHDGLQKQSAVDALPRHPASLGRKIDVAIIALLTVALTYFVYESRIQPGESTRQLMASGVVATHAVAVLPFSDASPGNDQDAFCDGLTDELIHSLVKIPGFLVPARATAFSLKGKALDVRDIGSALGVGHVLSGSVRRYDKKLRIMAELSDASTGYSLWSETYDRDLDDIFVIQDNIARSITHALAVTLRPEDVEALQRGRTDSTEAYEYYLRGKGYGIRTRGKALKAREMFEQAIELDPDFAAAHAALAINYNAFYYTYEKQIQADYLEAADQFSRRAIELDPQLAEAHVARGWFLVMKEGYEVGRHHYEKAIQLDPRLAEAYMYYGASAAANGDMESAVRYYERNQELEPDWQNYMILPQLYRSLGRKDAELNAYGRLVEMLRGVVRLNPDDLTATLVLGGSLVALGEKERGLEHIAWTVEHALADEARLLYNAACTYAIAGEVDKALHTLERAYKAGYADHSWMRQDSDLDPLRDHPRFLALLSKMESEGYAR